MLKRLSLGSAPDLYEAMKPLAENLEGGVIEDCGHYIPEEKPEELARLAVRVDVPDPATGPDVLLDDVFEEC